MNNSDSSGGAERRGSNSNSTSRPVSSFSPFPFGSPLQQSSAAASRSPFSGSPGQHLLLNSLARHRSANSTSLNRSANSTTGSPTQGGSGLTAGSVLVNGDSVYSPRLKGQDLYGGPVMFGNSGQRRARLLSSTPYSAALRLRERERAKARPGADTAAAATFNGSGTLLSRTGLSASSLHTPTPTTTTTTSSSSSSPVIADTMSSTARLILDTLDKMSTPLQDARKIPVPRAEKRKVLEDELNCSLGSPSRRRPRLGGGPASPASSAAGSSSGVGRLLNGPPLRKNYSPVPTGAGAGGRTAAAATTTTGGNRHGVTLQQRNSSSGNSNSSATSYPPPPPSPPPPTSSTTTTSSSSSCPPPSSPFSSINTPSATTLPSSSLFPPVAASTPFLPPPSTSSSSSGKIRGKLSERGRERSEKYLSEAAPALPAFLANTAVLPQLAVNPAGSLNIPLAPFTNPSSPPLGASTATTPAPVLSKEAGGTPTLSSRSTTTTSLFSSSSSYSGSVPSFTAPSSVISSQNSSSTAANNISLAANNNPPMFTFKPPTNCDPAAAAGGAAMNDKMSCIGSSSSSSSSSASPCQQLPSGQLSCQTEQQQPGGVVDGRYRLAAAQLDKFSFTAPTPVVASRASVVAASVRYTFSTPSGLSSHNNFSPTTTTTTSSNNNNGTTMSSKLMAAVSPSAAAAATNSCMFNSGSSSSLKPSSNHCLGSSERLQFPSSSPSSSSSSLVNNFSGFSAMPDVTNNLKYSAKGGLKPASRLPDLTASTGFGAAKELRTGSVMDILGKKA